MQLMLKRYHLSRLGRWNAPVERRQVRWEQSHCLRVAINVADLEKCKHTGRFIMFVKARYRLLTHSATSTVW